MRADRRAARSACAVVLVLLLAGTVHSFNGVDESIVEEPDPGWAEATPEATAPALPATAAPTATAAADGGYLAATDAQMKAADARMEAVEASL